MCKIYTIYIVWLEVNFKLQHLDVFCKFKVNVKIWLVLICVCVNVEAISEFSSLKDHIILGTEKNWWSLQSSCASPKIDKESLFRLLVVADVYTCRIS